MQDTMLHEGYINMGATASDYAEAIQWLIDGGLHETAARHLNELPYEHHFWEEVVDQIGDATLLMIGVDI